MFINRERKNHTVTLLCEVLEISKSSYYKYRDTVDEDYDTYLLIKEQFKQSKRTYGYRRMTTALRNAYGLYINEKKVRRIMRKYRIKPRYVKNRYVADMRKRRKENIKPDLLKRQFNQRGWVTDITYLIWNNKRAYLSTIIDLETRNVVSYRISNRNDMKLVIDTVNEAISKTKDLSGLILHSDQGFQYTSYEYRNVCTSNGILVSHSRKANPLDNSIIENFHSLMKKEVLYNNDFEDIKKYIQAVHDWIYFYNSSRIRLK